MQGIYVDGRRPKSKKAVREAVADDPRRVMVEATSLFGGEYGGSLDGWDGSGHITFVGPDPYNNRRFYGNVVVGKDGKFRVK